MTSLSMIPTRGGALARVRAERNGRMAEWMAVVLLWLRGYRVLARRWRGPGGEVDIVAVRGKRLAFVEVKFRTGANGVTVSPRQCRRLYATSAAFVACYTRYADYARGFDAVFVAPGGWPAYAADHLSPLVSAPLVSARPTRV